MDEIHVSSGFPILVFIIRQDAAASVSPYLKDKESGINLICYGNSYPDDVSLK